MDVQFFRAGDETQAETKPINQ